MKFAQKPTAVKKAVAIVPATKARSRTPPVIARARQAPSSTAVSAAREALTDSSTSARDAVAAALVNFSPGLVQVNPDGTIIPSGLFGLSFGDPKVGLDDSEMAGFFAAISTAINDSRVAVLIEAKLGDCGSSAKIGEVATLIQIWIDNPNIAA